MIGCHLLLIVGGGGHKFNRATSDQYEGSLSPSSPRPGPWARGSGLSMLLQQSEERRALRAPAQHFLVSSVSRVARVSCTVVPVSHGGSSPGWDEDGATLHPVLTHTGTITGHGVTAAQPGQLSIGRGECIVMRHCHNQARAPRGIAAAING